MRFQPNLLLSLPLLISACKHSEAPLSPAKPTATPAASAPATPPPAPVVPSTTAPGRPRSERACKPEELAAARKAAERLAGASEQDRARAALEQLDCTPDQWTDDTPNLEYYWAANEAAREKYKSGDLHGCIRTLAPLQSPSSPGGLLRLNLDETPLGKAIAKTDATCRDALTTAAKDFTQVPCAMTKKVEGADRPEDVGLPASVLPAGAAEACVAFDGGKRTKDGLYTCPNVVLLTRGASDEKPKRVKLKSTTAGPLTRSETCCNLDLAFANRDGKRMVLVTGDGNRDCNGGTATHRIYATYELTDDALRLVNEQTFLYE